MAKEYNIAKGAAACGACGKAFEAGQEITAVVTENGEGFERRDYCCPCWETMETAGKNGGSGQETTAGSGGNGGETAQDSPASASPKKPVQALALWRTHALAVEKKKRLFVDDHVLLQFFRNLAGTREANKIAFRFVLALVLMRKKLLVYERARKDEAGTAIWTLRIRGGDETLDVLEAAMDDEQVAEITGQIGQILEGEV